jgi:hypothetical protein
MPDGGPVTVTRAGARSIEEMRTLGAAIAARLRADGSCFQEQAALAEGVLPRTYWRWLDGEEPHHLAFQAEVLPAVYEQAHANEEAAETAIHGERGGDTAWANWHKWKLERRYRRIFGDLATKIELTGANGGPIEVVASREQALAALQAAAERDPALAEQIKKLGGG